MIQRYEKYKDSGVQWLGEIPGHWECTTMNRLLVSPLQYGASESGETIQQPGYCRYIRITDITLDGKLKEEGQKYLPEEVADDYPVEKGDLLFARSGATVGKSYLFIEDFKACFAGYLIKARFNKKYSTPHYVSYYTKSIQYDEWKNRIFIQATIQNIGADKYARLNIPIPPLSEQHSIVTYLDSKCSKIDEWINKKQKEVELLGEAKQRIIADAVTRGLNPNVKMKKTGVFWWKETPEHWQKIRLGFVLQKKNRQRNPNAELLVCTNKGKVVKRGDTKTGLIADSEEIYQGVAEGDLLIHGMDTWHGAIAVSDFNGMCTPVVHVCTSDENLYFVAYYMQVMAYSKIFKLISNGVRQNTSDFRSWSKVDKIPIMLPPKQEQDAIVSYISTKTTKIDSLMSAMNKEIKHLKEYKQRLISDVVTGQIKVC